MCVRMCVIVCVCGGGEVLSVSLGFEIQIV